MAESDEAAFKSIEVGKKVDPIVDLGNLAVEDQDPVDKFDADDIEENLLDLARDNVQCLVNELWKLPTKRAEGEVVVELPPPTTLLPREKPVPKQRPATKWQEYANAKGIHQRKKAKLVWDDVSQTWKPRWGMRRGNDDTKDWVVEVPQNADPYRDFIGERMDAKKERTAKNEMQRLRNVARARSQPAAAFSSPAPPFPVGVGFANRQKDAQQVARQMSRAREATASVGKFTPTLPSEKPPKNRGKKRKFEANEVGGASEKERQLKVLNQLASGNPKVNVNRMVAAEMNAEKNEEAASGGQKKRREGKSGAGVRRQQFWQQAKKGKTPSAPPNARRGGRPGSGGSSRGGGGSRGGGSSRGGSRGGGSSRGGGRGGSRGGGGRKSSTGSRGSTPKKGANKRR